MFSRVSSTSLKTHECMYTLGRRGYKVGVWKAIRNEWKGIKCKSHFSVGNERRAKSSSLFQGNLMIRILRKWRFSFRNYNPSQLKGRVRTN